MQEIIKTGSSGGGVHYEEEEEEDEEYSFNMEELDTESINVLVTLMLHCISYEQTTVEFFDEAVFQQIIEINEKPEEFDMIQVDDFYRILVEKGIRTNYEHHENLTDFLMLSKQHPMFILVANIKRALETIHQNEKFMKAIEDDIRAEE